MPFFYFLFSFPSPLAFDQVLPTEKLLHVFVITDVLHLKQPDLVCDLKRPEDVDLASIVLSCMRHVFTFLRFESTCKLGSLWKVVWCVMIWSLWRHRNDVVFKED